MTTNEFEDALRDLQHLKSRLPKPVDRREEETDYYAIENLRALIAENQALKIEMTVRFGSLDAPESVATFLGKPIEYWMNFVSEKDEPTHPAGAHQYDTGGYIDVAAHREQCAAAVCKRCCDSGTVQTGPGEIERCTCAAGNPPTPEVAGDLDFDPADIVPDRYEDMSREELIACCHAHDAHHSEHHSQEVALIAEVKSLRNLAREYSIEIMHHSGGGSEMFKTVAGEPYADPKLCSERIKEKIESIKNIKALQNAGAQWMPIETAPKDGTAFLALEGEFSYKASFHLQDDDGRIVWESYCGQPVVCDPEPTHWMPLPAAPTPSREG